MKLSDEIEKRNKMIFEEIEEKRKEEIINYLEELWGNFEKYSDSHFINEISKSYKDFMRRFFEMYILNYVWKNVSMEIDSKESGPDIIIKNIDTNIECTVPEFTKISKKIYKAGEKMEANEVPEEKIILRLTSAFKDKAEKYKKYIEEGLVKETDKNIIAISGRLNPFVINDYKPYWIIKSLYGIGYYTVLINKANKETIDTFLGNRMTVLKDDRIEIDTDYFLKEEYSHISAVMYSIVNPYEPIKEIGKDLILILNPNARNKIDISDYKGISIINFDLEKSELIY